MTKEVKPCRRHWAGRFMNKFIVLFCTFMVLFFSRTTAQTRDQVPSHPNIILIMADDLGYGDLGSYGQEMIHTPNIDEMAASGIRFTDFYSGSTVCSPSRESLLTGMHTGHTYIRGNFNTGDPFGDLIMPDEKTTIAEYLKPAGYQTVVIGKWGVGRPGEGPNTQGFDYSFCYLDQVAAHNYYPPYLWENEKKVMLEANRDSSEGTYSHNVFVSKTLEYIEDSDTEQPFFLYLPYTIPHGKHVIPDDTPYADKGWPQNFKNYAAMISLLDSDVGRIVQLLREKGIAKNTVVFFTSDNGANGAFAKFFKSNGPLRGNKRDLYDGGIREPLIAYWPGKIKPGRVSRHIAAAWDLLPTITEIAGVQPAGDIDGKSFLPELLGRRQPRHDYLYWEYYAYNWNWQKPDNKKPRNYLQSRAIRMGKWKAVKNDIYEAPDPPLELYNIEKDPSEAHNIAARHPEVVQKINRILDNCSTTDAPYFPYKGSK